MDSMPPRHLCDCGCGQETEIAPCTRWERNWRRGERKPCIDGHARIVAQRGRWLRARLARPHWFLIEDCGYDSPCWLWQGSMDGKGYGRLHSEGRRQPIHVLAYRVLRGPVPDGCELDHLCRITHCMNPDHLEPVSHAENMRRSANTRLDWRAVAAIRASEEPSRTLAERYGVSMLRIWAIRNGRTWIPD